MFLQAAARACVFLQACDFPWGHVRISHLGRIRVFAGRCQGVSVYWGRVRVFAGRGCDAARPGLRKLLGLHGAVLRTGLGDW